MYCAFLQIISQLFKVISLAKCVLTILEIKLEPALQNRTFVIIWSRRPYNRENRSFHIVERTRSLRCCAKMKNARAKRAKLYIFFYSQICKFVTFLLPSSSWLLISSLFASSQQRLRPTPFRSRSRV